MKKEKEELSVKNSENTDELYDDYETIDFDDVVKLMLGGHDRNGTYHNVIDTNGKLVTDPAVIKTVQDAMEGKEWFEHGGEFKNIISKDRSNQFKNILRRQKKKSSKQRNQRE